MFRVEPSVILKHKLTIPEYYLLLSIKNEPNTEKLIGKLLNSNKIGRALKDGEPDGYFIIPETIHTLADIQVESSPALFNKSQRIENLIPILQGIFPEGKNLNGQYWRCNKTDLKRRLVLFFEKYGDYTDEQIISATQAYVDSFKGSMKYMRLLKYFIWKEEIKDGSKVLVSELADIIENGNQITNDDWTTELR